jgi:hypothetical protein
LVLKRKNIKLFSRIQVKTSNKRFVFTFDQSDCQVKFSVMEYVCLPEYQIWSFVEKTKYSTR